MTTSRRDSTEGRHDVNKRVHAPAGFMRTMCNRPEADAVTIAGSLDDFRASIERCNNCCRALGDTPPVDWRHRPGAKLRGAP